MSSSQTRRSALRFLLSLPLLLFFGEYVYRALLFARERLLYPPRHAVELYVAGASVAAGYPLPAETAFPQQVSRLFGGRLAGLPISVRVLASGGGLSTYSEFFMLRRALRFRDRRNPAAVLIYAVGAKDLTERKSPARLLLSAMGGGLLDRSLLLTDLLFEFDKLFDPLGGRDLGTFEPSLSGMIDESLKAGAVPVLCTRAPDWSGFEPVDAAAPMEVREALGSIISAGALLERDPDRRAAADYYEYMADRYPQLAPSLVFHIAELDRSRGRYDEARALYQRAGDPGISRINEVTRRLAARYRLPMIDSGDLFASHSPHGLPGAGLFIDEGHPDVAGNLLLAGAFARELATLFHERPQASAGAGEIVAALEPTVAAKLACGRVSAALSALKTAAGWPYMRKRVEFAQEILRQSLPSMPATPANWVSQGLVEVALADRFTVPDKLLSRVGVGEPNGECLCLYVARWTDLDKELVEAGVSARIRRNVAESARREPRADVCLMAPPPAQALARADIAEPQGMKASDPGGSARLRRILSLLERITRLMPEDRFLRSEEDFLALRAETAVVSAAQRAGRPELMREGLNELRRSPSWEERRWMALTYQDQKDYARACPLLERLSRERPRYAEALSDLGLCHYLDGHSESAADDLRRALALDARLLPAYLTLSSIYVEQKKFAQALELYDRALALPAGSKSAAMREQMIKDRESLRARVQR